MPGSGHVPVALRLKLYAVAALDEFGPLLALYTLWFSDQGIGASETSVVFGLWATVAVLLEVPSGALADRVDRRWLLAVAFGLRALGIAVWLVWPGLLGVVTGAVLWAMQGAAASGAWEALVYEELEQVGVADAYASVSARLGQLNVAGIAVSTLLATALLAWGVPLVVLGWATVALGVLPAAWVLSLPRVGPGKDAAEREPAENGGEANTAASDEAQDDDEDDAPKTYADWWSTLRAGVGAVRSEGQLARLVVLGALLEGLSILDEYIPLVARERGASDPTVPWFVLAVWAGLLLGGEVAARRESLSARAIARLLALGVVALGLALWAKPLWALGFASLGVAAMHATWVLSDARFQARVPSATRATTTSVRALLAGGVNVGAFALVGAVAGGLRLSWALGVAMLGLVPAIAMVARWLPEYAPDDAQPRAPVEPTDRPARGPSAGRA